ncbi:MAG: hypothetical protein ACOY4I_07910 [Bacillota bacterium]
MKRDEKTVTKTPVTAKNAGNEIKYPPSKKPPFHDLPEDPARPPHS